MEAEKNSADLYVFLCVRLQISLGVFLREEKFSINLDFLRIRFFFIKEEEHLSVLNIDSLIHGKVEYLKILFTAKDRTYS